MELTKKKIITIISSVILIIAWVFIVSFFIHQNKLNEEVARVETREVLGRKYVNNYDGDYIILQIKYDDHSKFEKYSI